jgi:hypothetical protein
MAPHGTRQLPAVGQPDAPAARLGERQHSVDPLPVLDALLVDDDSCGAMTWSAAWGVVAVAVDPVRFEGQRVVGDREFANLVATPREHDNHLVRPGEPRGSARRPSSRPCHTTVACRTGPRPRLSPTWCLGP